MNHIKRLVSQPMSAGRDMAAKRTIRQFAHKFGMVYFGQTDPRDEDFELIRGKSLSSTHVDSHYCVGSYKGYDISLVERCNEISQKHHSTQKYHWLIMQVDLRKRQGMPRVFIDSTQYDEAFYGSIRLKVPNLAYSGSLFVGHDPLFTQCFRVYAPLDRFDDADEILTPATTAMLAHHFRQFDYELAEDYVLVYARDPNVSSHLLHEMLRVGSWLAAQLDWADNG